jgi:hypothetical protein
VPHAIPTSFLKLEALAFQMAVLMGSNTESIVLPFTAKQF